MEGSEAEPALGQCAGPGIMPRGPHDCLQLGGDAAATSSKVEDLADPCFTNSEASSDACLQAVLQYIALSILEGSRPSAASPNRDEQEQRTGSCAPGQRQTRCLEALCRPRDL